MRLFKKRIICIHSLDDKTLTEGCFRQYVKNIKLLGYRFASLEEVVSDTCKGKVLSLTIDDGYKNIVTNLLPILEDLEVPALLFVPTGLLNKKANDEQLLKNDCYKDQDMMSVKDLQYWINKGFQVGFHTHHHINLSKVDFEQAEKDVEEGMNFFKQINYKPSCFAYPFGLLPTDKLQYEKLLSLHGIKHAFTFSWGNVEGADSYYIPRFSLGNNQPILWSIMKTVGVLDWYNKIKRNRNE